MAGEGLEEKRTGEGVDAVKRPLLVREVGL